MADGLDGLDVLEAVESEVPDLTLHEFIGALALHYAAGGAPGFVLDIFEKGGRQ